MVITSSSSTSPSMSRNTFKHGLNSYRPTEFLGDVHAP
jgi:hypothetical protein